METNHLNQYQLSKRWTLSQRTLERWRWMGIGPKYLKVGGRVAYRLADIEEYEAAQIRQSTTEHSFANSQTTSKQTTRIAGGAQ